MVTLTNMTSMIGKLRSYLFACTLLGLALTALACSNGNGSEVPDSGAQPLMESGIVKPLSDGQAQPTPDGLQPTPDSGTQPTPDSGTQPIPDTGTAVKACQVTLNKTTQVYCATKQESAKLLGTVDDYINALSPFDLSFMSQTEGAVSTTQFIQHITKQALDWTPAESQKIKGILSSVDQKLSSYSLNLPASIALVKVAPNPELPYTRMSFVVLPETILQKSASDLETIMIHELFHILSRHDPALRKKLYAIIGFTQCPELTYPKELESLKLTNPDTPVLQHSIQLQYMNQTYDFIPITYASKPYSKSMGSNPFSVMEFKLLGVQVGTTDTLPLYWSGGSGPLFTVDPSQVPAYYQKVGMNTQYVIHPDEILADNFVMVITGQTGQSPQILSQIKQVLQGP
jgi:hypothetical protein